MKTLEPQVLQRLLWEIGRSQRDPAGPTPLAENTLLLWADPGVPPAVLLRLAKHELVCRAVATFPSLAVRRMRGPPPLTTRRSPHSPCPPLGQAQSECPSSARHSHRAGVRLKAADLSANNALRSPCGGDNTPLHMACQCHHMPCGSLTAYSAPL